MQVSCPSLLKCVKEDKVKEMNLVVGKKGEYFSVLCFTVMIKPCNSFLTFIWCSYRLDLQSTANFYFFIFIFFYWKSNPVSVFLPKIWIYLLVSLGPGHKVAIKLEIIGKVKYHGEGRTSLVCCSCQGKFCGDAYCIPAAQLRGEVSVTGISNKADLCCAKELRT